MRCEGRITEWNDERGFGYVVPVGGGTRVFVHISAFPRGAERPARGKAITYQPGQDAKGRPRAKRVHYQGDAAAPIEALSRLPRRSLALTGLAAVLLLGASGLMPWAWSGACLLLSLLSYLSYWLDKAAARKGARRTPENTLHLLDLLGGWPGGLLAQQQFRHKTAKGSYQWIFWLSVLANLLANAWLLHSGSAWSLLR